MARKSSVGTPTEQEILGYNNVPLNVAAKFIGWSSSTITKALIQERAPFGVAAQTGVGKSGRPNYTYNISPGLLVKYKNGELNAWRLNEVVKLAADGIQDVLDQRMNDAAELLLSIRTGAGRRRK